MCIFSFQGDLFIAKYDVDGSWYRALVLDVKATEVKVQFIDFGNSDTIAKQNLIVGESTMFDVPALADKYVLGDVVSKNPWGWDSSDVEQVAAILENQEFNFTALEEYACGSPLTVRLERDDKVRLSKELISQGCARPYDNRHIRMGSIPMVELPLKKVHHVYVSYCETPVSFWLQLVSEEDKLADLNEKTQTFAENNAPVERSSIYPLMLCAAFYEDVFYRAVLCGYDEGSNLFDVFFVDYGNTAKVPGSDVRQLSPDLRDEPALAYKCALRGDKIASTDFNLIIESENIHAVAVQQFDNGLHIVDLFQDEGSATKQEPPKVSSPKLQYPAQLEIRVGDMHDICICHVERNGFFHCQLLSMAFEVEELLRKTQKCSGAYTGSLSPGVVCCAETEDGFIYRAEIKSGPSSDGKVQVKFVDYGDVATVTKDKMYNIPPELCAHPPYAIQCFEEAAKNRSLADWTEILDGFNSKQPLVGKFVVKKSGFYDIELYNTQNGDLRLVDEKNGIPKPVDPNVPLSRNQPVQSNVRPQTDLDDEYFVRAPKVKLNPPKVDPLENVLVTYIISEVEFFVQLVKYQAEIDVMQEQLDLFYKGNPQYPALSSTNVGDFCATAFSDDETFYRAKVEEVKEGCAKVRFVDYGNDEVKPLKELKILDEQFAKIRVGGVFADLRPEYDQLTVEDLEGILLDQTLVVQLEPQLGGLYQLKPSVCPQNKDILNQLRR